MHTHADMQSIWCEEKPKESKQKYNWNLRDLKEGNARRVQNPENNQKKRSCNLKEMMEWMEIIHAKDTPMQYLCHFLSVGLRVQRSFCKQYWMFFRGNTKLIVESMMPNFLHIIPVGDNSMFNWILQGQDTSLALGFISHITVFLSHTNHDTLKKGDMN